MRDNTTARRALLALAAGVAALGLVPLGAAPRARRKPGLRVVALDPGHGGIDPGAISPTGLYEKAVTLPAARELARLLEATERYRPVLTRQADVFVPLRERVAKAHAEHADLFLSIHADALPNHDLRGLSVYTLSEQASDRETAALAARENSETIAGGIRLPHEAAEIGAILFDLSRRDTYNRSLALARAIVDELGHDVPLLEKPQRAAGFVVLTAPDIPSALVELGCLSNPADERLLPQPAFQRRAAHGLARAIDDYFARSMSS